MKRDCPKTDMLFVQENTIQITQVHMLTMYFHSLYTIATIGDVT